ncbi:iron-containing alcohol dehydrogenase [Oceanobacillus locisalsi]|uniref:Iron-containing alcohol dehydrogenase n=1 Tax=Oceanobacillus locisalsi TaxID=546107 RepID=A0ABW3NL67_9BACI
MGESHVVRTPQTVHYGKDAFKKIGMEASIKGKKTLIISNRIMEKLGYVSECRDLLLKERIESVVYLGVESEPTDIYVAEALELCQKEKCDVVISVGGGSCIDTAKAVAVAATNGIYIGEYMGGNREIEQQPLPHIAVPTTAGTGSEATDVTVITDTTNDVKMMIKQPLLMPNVAIVDPVLSMSSPKSVTSATGIDALSHAVEAYISKKAQPMTDMLALSAIEKIVNNIKPAYNEGKNVDAREAMSIGSMQAGMAFSNSSVCLVHGMSRPIGALFHVPHGISNAMLLPAVLDFSRDDCVNQLADLAPLFDAEAEKLSKEEAADLTVYEVKKLCYELDVPNLQGWGIEKEKFEAVVSKMAEDALASGSPQNNPRVPTKEEVEELYYVCFSYQFSVEKMS